MVAVTLAASSAFASPRATSTTSSTVRPSPLTTTVRMATACHPPASGAAGGLATALAGCDAVVDASNSSSRKPAGILVDGSRRLLEAEAAAGVKHHVCVSIVGCDQVSMSYFRVKAEQERVVGQGTVPWSIVRSTQ